MDRQLIKSQARQLIKGVWFYLCIISAIVGILAYGHATYNTAYEASDKDNFSDWGNYKADNYEDFFNQFGSDSNNNDADNSGDMQGNSSDHYSNFTGSIKLMNSSFNNVVNGSAFSGLYALIAFLMSPLVATLAGYYVLVIRGRKVKLGDGLGYLFSQTFNESYGKKLILTFLTKLIVGFMTCLLIVPGIIFGLKYFFAYEIFCENPKMKATQALKLSSRMTDGSKGELFELVLSFIGWFLLSILTFGVLLIYTVPYFKTVKALYYQNFKIKLTQEGRISDFDFIPEDEQKRRYYEQNFGQQQNGYQQNYAAPNNYQNPYQQNANAYNPANNPQPEPPKADEVNVDGVQFEEATYSEPVDPEEPNFCEETEPKDPVDNSVDPVDTDEPEGPSYL